MSALPAKDAHADSLFDQAEWMIARVEGDTPSDAADLVQALRDARLYPTLLRLAEAILRKRPDEHRVRRLYAQGLIEQGHVIAAIDVLERLVARLRADHPERQEAIGLLGRANKQIFFETRDRHGPAARSALRKALQAYRVPFEQAPSKNTWHGINLVALLAFAQRRGLPLPRGLAVDMAARQVLDALDKVSDGERDEWHHATRAEAALALQDWTTVQSALQAYIATPDAKAFMVQSTLRQFTQVWELDRDTRGTGPALVNLLQARLLALSTGEVRLSPASVRQTLLRPQPEAGLLEAVLGTEGVKTWQWWRAGLECARAVGIVRSRTGERVGTAWLIKAADLGLPVSNPDEHVAITNFHVVNPEGSHGGLTPDQTELVFEAADTHRCAMVAQVLWTSPPEDLDVAVLRLETQVPGITPLSMARKLPMLDSQSPSRVYIIGYPGGRVLAFSMQDNALIDHEGPEAGKPKVPGVCRVHYRAPTEGGSSGSPVFNAEWKVIALHHSGGKDGVPRLNGQTGTYAANEGIWIQSIREAR